MNAMAYLVRKQAKNFFRDILHHPSKLILYIFFIGFMVFVYIDSSNGQPASQNYKDIRILHGILLAWLLFLGTTSVLTSLKNGANVFKMSDVNFLFVSPVSPKNVLAYGLLKQMTGILFGFIFMAFYSGTLIDSFQITMGDVIVMILATVLFLFTIQVFSLLLYSFVNGKPKRISAVRAAIYAVIGLNVFVALTVFMKNGGTGNAVYAAIASSYLEAIPLAGWFKGAVFALINGNIARAAVFTVLNTIVLILSIVLFVKTDTDYYEDVLENAEKRFELVSAAKERRAYSRENSGAAAKRVKVGKTGIGKGCGADTFFYKHICEARRRSRLIFIDKFTAVLLIINLISYFVIRSINGGKMSAGEIMLISTGISIYILFFMDAAGDWTRELMKPYIYLVPEPPFKKLIWASMTTIIKPAVEGTAVFAVTCAVARANPLTGLLCILLYASFGLLFTAGNVLSQRVFGGMSNRGVTMFLYMFMIVLIVAPGAAVSITLYVVQSRLPGIVIGLPIVIWNVIVSCLIVYFCRNLLSYFADVS